MALAEVGQHLGMRGPTSQKKNAPAALEAWPGCPGSVHAGWQRPPARRGAHLQHAQLASGPRVRPRQEGGDVAAHDAKQVGNVHEGELAREGEGGTRGREHKTQALRPSGAGTKQKVSSGGRVSSRAEPSSGQMAERAACRAGLASHVALCVCALATLAVYHGATERSRTEAVVPATVPALKSRMTVDTTVSTSCPQKLRERVGGRSGEGGRTHGAVKVAWQRGPSTMLGFQRNVMTGGGCHAG